MIYLMLGKGFEEIEAIATADIIRRARLPLQLVGIGGTTVEGAHAIRVEADITIEQMDLTRMDMLILPGGGEGVASIQADSCAMEAVKFAAENGIYVAAICAAPTILGKLGYLDGRNAVCYPSMQDGMGKAVMHMDQTVVQDGQFVTGRGPGAALDFGLAIADLFDGEFDGDTIAEYMVYERG